MTGMLASIYDDVLIRHVNHKDLASEPSTFVQFPLHNVTEKELSFTRPFELITTKDTDELDGWVIWFDTYFLSSRESVLPVDAQAEKWPSGSGSDIAFTTGPHGPETHWRQGTLLINREKMTSRPLKAGSKITGEVTYRKRKENARELEIEMAWEVIGSGERGQQKWFMR